MLPKHEHNLCTVCGANDWRVRYAKTPSGKVWQCQPCHFLAVLTPPKNQIIRNSDDVMTQETEVNQEYYTHVLSGKLRDAELRLRDLEKAIGKQKTLLDVGCYVGIFPHVAKKAGWSVQALEPIRVAAEWGREHFNIPIQINTLREAHLPANHVDVVTSWEVIEHIVDPRVEITEMVRVLKPGGHAVIETPNAGSWLAHLTRSWWRQWIPGHVSLFSPVTLTKLCESLGLIVVKIQYGRTKAASLGLLAVTIRDHISRPLGLALLTGLRWLHLTDRVIILWLPDVFTLYAKKP